MRKAPRYGLFEAYILVSQTIPRCVQLGGSHNLEAGTLWASKLQSLVSVNGAFFQIAPLVLDASCSTAWHISNRDSAALKLLTMQLTQIMIWNSNFAFIWLVAAQQSEYNIDKKCPDAKHFITQKLLIKGRVAGHP